VAANEFGYLTTAETLAYLRTAPRTLYRFLATGQIPAVRVGRQWRFRKSDLDRWVESRRRRRRPDQTPTPVTADRARRRRVLVADVDASARDLVVAMFAGAKYDVEAVSDGLHAIARLRTDPFDLVVTDLNMPGLEGMELAREAKRLWPAIKVVIVTANPSQSSAIEAVNMGLDGYLAKPLRAIELLTAAARVLEPGSILSRGFHSGLKTEGNGSAVGSAVGSVRRSW
jgi:excisionase family DNA binding protein